MHPRRFVVSVLRLHNPCKQFRSMGIWRNLPITLNCNIESEKSTSWLSRSNWLVDRPKRRWTCYLSTTSDYIFKQCGTWIADLSEGDIQKVVCWWHDLPEREISVVRFASIVPFNFLLLPRVFFRLLYKSCFEWVDDFIITDRVCHLRNPLA